MLAAGAGASGSPSSFKISSGYAAGGRTGCASGAARGCRSVQWRRASCAREEEGESLDVAFEDVVDDVHGAGAVW